MQRPNKKQFIVLWSGVVWTLACLAFGDDVLVRLLLAGFIITAVLFWQLSSKPDDRAVAPLVQPDPDLSPDRDVAKTAVTSPAASLASTSHRKSGPSGVGGLLIVVLLGPLLTPILATFVISAYGNVWSDSWFYAVAVAGGIFSGWSIYVALGLLNRWSNAPKLAQAQLFTSWMFWTGIEILAVVLAVEGDFGKLGSKVSTESVTAQLTGGVFGTVVWMSYLKNSRRVHATYGPLPLGPIRPDRARIIGLTAGIVVSCLVFGIASYQRQPWYEFHSDDGHYTIEAPGPVRKSPLKDGLIEDVFGDDVRGFVVSRTPLVPGSRDAQAYCESVRDTVIANLKGSILKSSPINLNGNPGIDFSAIVSEQGATSDIHGRVYATADEGYLLLVSGTSGGRTTAESNRFFNSFTIQH